MLIRSTWGRYGGNTVALPGHYRWNTLGSPGRHATGGAGKSLGAACYIVTLDAQPWNVTNGSNALHPVGVPGCPGSCMEMVGSGADLEQGATARHTKQLYSCSLAVRAAVFMAAWSEIQGGSFRCSHPIEAWLHLMESLSKDEVATLSTGATLPT